MKTKTFFALITLCFLLFIGFFNGISAQTRPTKTRPQSLHYLSRMDTVERKGVFISYPSNFIASTLKVGYEFKISHNKGLKLIGTLGSSDNNSDWYGLNKFTEFGLEGQLRFYMLKDRPALNGFYLAPYAAYKAMTYTGNTTIFNAGTGQYESGQSTSVSNFTLGYVLGYQWIFNSTLTIDAFIGGGFNTISGDNSQGNLGTAIFAYRNGIDIHSGIGLGVAF